MAIFLRKGCTNTSNTVSQLSRRPRIINLACFQGAARRVVLAAFLSVLCLVTGCTQSNSPVQLLELPNRPTGSEVRSLSGDIKEVAPPAIFLDLSNLASDLQPQVEIAYPKPNQVIDKTEVAVKIKLRGLSIYKDEKTQLGPHLKVILDNQPAQDIYTLEEPVEFSTLLPGSHTLRVLAVLPWGESFKNIAAYAQTTFHILAETEENTPNPEQPLLTYSEPQGSFGAQPVLLDFYLSNAPLHLIAQESAEDSIQDWKIRCIVNGQSFLFDQWQPIYLKGFKPGQNWVQVELVDEQGDRIKGPFNSTIRLINYNPEQKDTLSKLIRGELLIEQVGQIVVPDYAPPLPQEGPAEGSVDTEEITEDNSEKLSVPLEEPDSDLPRATDLEQRETERESLIKTSEGTSADPFDDRENKLNNSVNSKELDFEQTDYPDRPTAPTVETPILEDESPNLLEDSGKALPKENLQQSKAVPDSLIAPANETTIDFFSEPEDTDEDTATEALPEVPSALDQFSELEPDTSATDKSDQTTQANNLRQANPSKTETPTNSRFLEQLKTRWRSFQKEQLNSQSSNIEPSTTSLESASQIEPQEEMNESIEEALDQEAESMSKPEEKTPAANDLQENVLLDSQTTEAEKQLESQQTKIEDRLESVEPSKLAPV